MKCFEFLISSCIFVSEINFKHDWFHSNLVFFMFGVLVWGIVFWETSDDVSFFWYLFKPAIFDQYSHSLHVNRLLLQYPKIKPTQLLFSFHPHIMGVGSFFIFLSPYPVFQQYWQIRLFIGKGFFCLGKISG